MNTKEELVGLAHENLISLRTGEEEIEEKLVLRAELKIDPFNLETEIQSFPFLTTVSNGLKNTVNSTPEDEIPRQFILTGQPSAGKSTEMRRIAKRLVEEWDQDDYVVHLCCLQNSSAAQTPIDSKEDLWNWVMKSHESRIIAQQRYSLTEFLDIHTGKSSRPIILIDTLDLLIYGKIGGENKTIIGYWIELIQELEAHDATILWSCRRFEFNQIRKDFNNSEKMLTQIELPALEWREVRNQFENTTSMGMHVQDFFTVLGVAFPIIVGYKKDNRKWNSNIEREFVNLHNKAKDFPITDSDIAKSAGPVNWIRESLEGKLATDILYEGLVNKLINHVQGLYHFDSEQIKSAWESIELAFFDAAGPNSEISRIQVESAVIDDLALNEHVIALVMNAKKFGILTQNKSKSPFEMSHQLFVEYCVWKHRGKSPNYTDWIHKFPSTIFRDSKNKNIDNDAVREGQEWFRCFIIFNKQLALDFDGREDLPTEWQRVIRQSAIALKIKRSKGEIPESTDIHHDRTINSEKHEILKEVNGKDPFLVNGPPGVGKSHLSYVWIDKKASQDLNWNPLKPGDIRMNNPDSVKEKAYFMTLSQKLKLQIREKVEKYYDTCPKPVHFESWAIQEYIVRLEEILCLTVKPFEFADFNDEWKKKVQGGDNFILQANKVGVQALWNEFENIMIGKFGNRMATETYVEKTKLFTYSRSPDSTAREFAKWATNAGDRDHQSLAERAGHCIKKLLDVFENGTLSQKEEVLSLQPNILVLDEIQDLPFQVILLMLIMQNGGRDCVMMCGDDEQTLELIQFDWNQIFTRISTAVVEISDEFPNSEHVISIVNKWGKGEEESLTLQKVVKNHTHHLLEVERCVPDIVDFMKDSWKTSVSTKIDSFVEIQGKKVKGTAHIKPGGISKARAMKNKADKIESGIDLYEKVSEEELVNAAREIYDNGLDIAILLPNEKRHTEFSELLEKRGIKLDVWTPRLIKGLEYPIVIATDPWNITTEHFQNVVNRNELSNWKEAQEYYENKSKLRTDKSDTSQITRTITAIELITKQRKRHANIMLSRARNQLIVALLKEEKEDSMRTESPETSKPKNSSFPIHFVKEGNTDDKNHGINKLIERLSLIILAAETSEDRKQISLKSGHIIQTLKKKGMESLILPFYLLERHPKMQDELNPVRMFDGGIEDLRKKMGLKETSLNGNQSLMSFKIKGENKALNEFMEEVKNYQHPLPALTELLQYLTGASSLTSLGGDGGVALPVNVVQTYHTKINSFISKFSEIDEECFTEKEDVNNRDVKSHIGIIAEYIRKTFFGGYHPVSYKFEAWVEHAQIIKLDTYQVEIDLEEKHNHRFKMIPKGSKNSIVFGRKFPEEIKDDFWREGIGYLNSGTIRPKSLSKIATHLEKQLKGNNLPNQGIIFFSRLITNIIRSGEYDIGDICKFCFSLEKQGHDVKKPGLFELLSKQDKKILAEKLLQKFEEDHVAKSLFNDSNGLFKIFSEYCFKQERMDTQYLEKLMKFGKRMVEELEKSNTGEAANTIWENKALKQIKNHCLKIIQKTNFAKSFSPEAEGYSFKNLLGNESGGLGQTIRLDLNDVGRQNIIEFSITKLWNKKKLIVTDDENNEELKEEIKKNIEELPFINGFDSKDWAKIMKNRKFIETLIKIPYDSSELHELSSDQYFGREIKKFRKQARWNKSLGAVFQELKITDIFKQINNEFEKLHFSIFDGVYEGTEERKNIQVYFRERLNDAEWRKEVLSDSNGSEILRTENGLIGVIPHLNGLEVVRLIDAIYTFFAESIDRIRKKLDDLHNEQKVAKRYTSTVWKNVDEAMSFLQYQYQYSNFWKKMKLKKSAQSLDKILKRVENGAKNLQEQVDVAQRSIQFFSLTQNMYLADVIRFIDQLIEYFQGEKSPGKMRFNKSKQWALLQDGFLKETYPSAYSALNVGDIQNAFSLERLSHDTQITLIKLLQSFGNKNVTMVGPMTENALSKYDVMRPDYDNFIDRHQKALEIFYQGTMVALSPLS